MNKQEYLSELEAHLASLSEEERNDALRFYEEYFEDAGPENEQQVISELGKPFALAKSIICEQSAYSKSKSFANYKASISATTTRHHRKKLNPMLLPIQHLSSLTRSTRLIITLIQIVRQLQMKIPTKSSALTTNIRKATAVTIMTLHIRPTQIRITITMITPIKGTVVTAAVLLQAHLIQ